MTELMSVRILDYRKRAAAIREAASSVSDEERRRALQFLAERYDEMADRLESTSADHQTVARKTNPWLK